MLQIRILEDKHFSIKYIKYNNRSQRWLKGKRDNSGELENRISGIYQTDEVV